jgi:RimJ/RimL family protein N-acetyltransferase
MTSPAGIALELLSDLDISEEYLETLNDSAYMKYSRNSDTRHTAESQSKYIREFSNSCNMLFGIKDVDSGKLLGTINCYVDFLEMTLDLGFLVFKNNHGKGYATEGLRLFLNYLSDHFPGMTAVIGSHKDNLAMHKVAKNLGFEFQDSGDDDLIENFKFIRLLPKLTDQSVPRIPVFFSRVKTIGVAAHDAGGAEQISWLVRNLPHRILAFVRGPAKRIFINSGVTFSNAEQLSNIMECDLVVTGSGWMSHLERAAINEAKLKGIPCITILDHWVNYLERFGSDTHPQIIAVTNSVALQMAQEKFPDALVYLLPDFQIESYQRNLLESNKLRNSVLIILEPTSSIHNSFSLQDCDLETLVNIAIFIMNSRKLDSIIIRPHPSQLEDIPSLERLKNLSDRCHISSNTLLLNDLESSAVVIGFSSYALYISSMCGIETYSYFAGKTGHWTENFPELSILPGDL